MTNAEAIKELSYIADEMPSMECADWKEAISMAIKALEQEPILDKIRAEIEELDRYYDNDYFSTNNRPMYACSDVLQIIDKYKIESEK